MAALAAAGEVDEKDVYETGYRWNPTVRAWTIVPECRNQPFTPNGPYMGLDGKWKGETSRAMVVGAQRVMDNWTDGVTLDLYTDAFRRELDSRIASGEIKLKNETDREELVHGAERFYELFVGKTYELSEGRRFYIVPDDEARTKRNRGNASAWAERAFHFISASMEDRDGQKVTVDGSEDGIPVRQYSAPRAKILAAIIQTVKGEKCSIQGNGRIHFYGEWEKPSGKKGKADVIAGVIADIDEDGNLRGTDIEGITFLATSQKPTDIKAKEKDLGIMSLSEVMRKVVTSRATDALPSASPKRDAPSQTPVAADVNSENSGRAMVTPRLPSPEFAMDGTIVDALPAHLREDARAIVAERADTPAWMVEPDGTPTELNERDWLRREAEARHEAGRRFAISGLYTAPEDIDRSLESLPAAASPGLREGVAAVMRSLRSARPYLPAVERDKNGRGSCYASGTHPGAT